LGKTTEKAVVTGGEKPVTSVEKKVRYVRGQSK